MRASPLKSCGSCGAEIFFAPTPTGGRTPLDAKPAGEGNVILVLGVAHVVSAAVARADGAVVYMPHHATCPNADEHRRQPIPVAAEQETLPI